MNNVWPAVFDDLYPPQHQYAADPIAWAKEQVRVELWSKQRAILESVRDNKLTAVRSCNTVGKSFSAATVCCWWLDTHPPGTARIITTAPTDDQVRGVLWNEIRQIHKIGNLPGRTVLKGWWIGGYEAGIGRKPSEYADASFSGYHAPHLLVVIDEAGGVPGAIWDAVDTLTNTKGGKVLAIGNPNNPQSMFAKVCKPDSGWSVIHISAFDSPNFTGENVPELLANSLVTPTAVEQTERTYGRDSAMYAISVLGEFPVDKADGIVPWSWAVACRAPQGRRAPAGEALTGVAGIAGPELASDGVASPGIVIEMPLRCAGLDVAAGGDRTVMRERVGSVVGREAIWRDTDSAVAAGKIMLTLREWGTQRLVIEEDGGYGWGLIGPLKECSRFHNPQLDVESSHGAEVIGVVVGGKPSSPDRFLNKRAELWWVIGREYSRQQLWDLSHPTCDDDLLAELTTPNYKVLDSKGRIKVEPKVDVKARLGHSPDRADALLLAFHEPFTQMTPIDVSAYERIIMR